MYLIIGNRLNWNFNEMFTFDLLSFRIGCVQVFRFYIIFVSYFEQLQWKPSHEL